MRLHPCFVLVVALALDACHPDGNAKDSHTAPTANVSPGEWTLFHFRGGPPPPGQITDTLSVDPAGSPHHIHLVRNVAGAGADRECRTEAADDAAWSELIAALADKDLEAAFAHSDRLPGLVMDAGYFACKHNGKQIAVSDVANPADAPVETAALRRLGDAYQKVTSSVMLQSDCASLK